MIRVLLVDDEERVRQGLRMRLALEPDLTVVGEASNGMEAIYAARTLVPDVVVMDMHMPRMDGIMAARWLREVTPSAAVVMLSIYDDERTRERAQQAGVAAFVAKQNNEVEQLLEALRQVSA